MIQCFYGFLRILVSEFAASSKPPSRDNHRKDSDQGLNSVTNVQVEPKDSNQDCRKATPLPSRPTYLQVQ